MKRIISSIVFCCVIATVVGLVGCATAPAPVLMEQEVLPGPNDVLVGVSTDGAVECFIRGPKFAETKIEYENEVIVRAVQNVANVIVKENIPEGLEHINSIPEAKVIGNKLVWKFQKLNSLETRVIKTSFLPIKDTFVSNCVSLSADIRSCAVTKINEPVFVVKKTGPKTVLVGDEIRYNIYVKNTGSAIVKDVVIIDQFSDSLEHESGRRKIVINVGDLAPGEEEETCIDFIVAKRGKIANSAIVESSNAGKTMATAWTDAQIYDFKLNKSAPKKVCLGKPATFKILVENTGDRLLTDINIVDKIPAGLFVVKAENAKVYNDCVVWEIPSLKVGEAIELEILLVAKACGKYRNVVTAAAEGIEKTAVADTVWKGFPGLSMEVIDSKDPLLVGEETSYFIEITNQGLVDDSNMEIVVEFPNEIKPLKATGQTQATISGNTIKFKSLDVLRAKDTVVYAIEAKATSEGDGRVNFKVKTNSIKTPISEEESTRVY